MPTAMVFSEEQEELRSSVRRFCQGRSPSAEVRRLMETAEGYSPPVWKQMATQLGLQGLAIPERHGGLGFGCVELGIVLEEMGRTLLCAPYFATVAMAANALIASGDEVACAAHLPGIAAGETIATLALAEDTGRWDEESVTLAAERSGSAWTLTGHKSFVVDGSIANLVLVAARTWSGISLFAVDGGAEGLIRTALPTLDQTRKLARLEFARTPASLVGAEGGASPGLSRTLDLAAIALAAEQVGGAQACLDMSVEYAKVRYQFGRPIGSFQAIKHRCADMLLEVDSARSAAQYAAWAVAEDSPDVPVAASLAKSTCSEAYFHAAAQNIQIHGGIGFTWEHDAHLYFKRAKSSQLFLGDAAYHREHLAQRIGV
ncbi:MAG TPA: acyl-CoA dehydrogenase family protein [Candidatus Dormibacteraeota bacterium]|nr:acyl-CoA dehydrogenase family protein [Candidatus Dormibacteraeota bacterium]